MRQPETYGGTRVANHPCGAVVWQRPDTLGRWLWTRSKYGNCSAADTVTTLAEAVALALSPAPRTDGVEVKPGATTGLYELIAELEAQLARYQKRCGVLEQRMRLMLDIGSGKWAIQGSPGDDDDD